MKKLILATVVAVLSSNLALAKEQLSIPVLKEKIAKGTIIKADYISLKKMDTARMPRTVITDKSDVIGLEATRNLNIGSPIYTGYVRVSPDVHQNGDVTILYNVPGIKLSTIGKAMEDGNIGASISVMNKTSKKLIIGTIIAKNKVKVE